VYGGSEDEWVTFGSGRMIMGADSQLPMTGGSEYITESQLPSHSHPYSNGYQTTYGAHGAPLGNSYSSYGTLQQTATTGTNTGGGQAYYPKYIQTYMWTKVLYYDSIIYSASGDAMGTFAEVLGSLYPVGAQIYRTSAITQHPSDATKVQPFPSEAPLQQWELVDNGDNKVLEKFASVCNTTSLSGRATMQNVTAIQPSTTSYVDMTGSVISDFVPPVGTKEIVYTYTFKYHYYGDDDQDVLCQLYVKKDSGSFVRVSKAEHYTKTLNSYHSDTMTLRWVFKVDDADNSDYGSFAAATPSLSFKWQAQGTSNDWQLHTTHHNNVYVTPPSIMLECIGELQVIKYKRTL